VPEEPARVPVRPVRPLREPGKAGLGPGDEFKVDVARHEEFSGVWSLDAGGNALIPDGGAFGVGNFTGESFSSKLGRLAGLKPEEVARRIAEGLKPFLKAQPRVTVRRLGRVEE
jgi:protein involved in polysaccharide export with SLBB domain